MDVRSYVYRIPLDRIAQALDMARSLRFRNLTGPWPLSRMPRIPRRIDAGWPKRQAWRNSMPGLSQAGQILPAYCANARHAPRMMSNRLTYPKLEGEVA